MKRRILLFLCIALVVASCSRALTPLEAANSSHKHCRNLR